MQQVQAISFLNLHAGVHVTMFFEPELPFVDIFIKPPSISTGRLYLEENVQIILTLILYRSKVALEQHMRKEPTQFGLLGIPNKQQFINL